MKNQNKGNTVGSGGDGKMSEYGFTAGNTGPQKKVAKNSEPTAPNLDEHKLQHSDYGSLTGNQYTE